MHRPLLSVGLFCNVAHRVIAAGMLTLLVLPAGVCLGGAPQVAVHPEETDEILANPGMGWQTFHRTAKQDKNLPAWIPSTVHYARWGWGELEPEHIAAALLDRVLADSREVLAAER